MLDEMAFLKSLMPQSEHLIVRNNVICEYCSCIFLHRDSKSSKKTQSRHARCDS